MKKIISIVMVSISLLALPLIAFAEQISPTPIKLVENQQAGISPDSNFYPLKLFFEDVSVALAFNKQNKAQVLINLADKRVEEALFMDTQDNLKKANEWIEQSATLLEKANHVLHKDNIKDQITDKSVIQISTNVSDILLSLDFDDTDASVSSDLIEIAKQQVVKTMAVHVYLTSKQAFSDVNEAISLAKDAYKQAKEFSDDDAIRAVHDALIQTLAYQNEMEISMEALDLLKDRIQQEYQPGIDQNHLDDE